MNLTDEQRKAVAGWIEEGLKLSDIQKKLASDFSQNLTYMEVRFLVDDLKLTPKDPQPPAAQPAATAVIAGQGSAGGLAPSPAATGAGGVSVTMDQVTRPGSLVSGSVTFSDGNSAEWYLDQAGRLGLAPKTEGYRPSQQDLISFQTELQKELQRAGF